MKKYYIMKKLLLYILLFTSFNLTAQNNYSMSFDGDDIINSITTNSILNDYSIAFNFKTDYVQPQPGNNDQIFRYWINNNIYEINIGGNINGVNYTGQVFAFPSGGTFDYSSGQTYNDGVWHTAVIIKNNSNNLLETYVDGTLSSTFTETPNVGTLEIEAGGDFAHHYEGNIDNLSIWSKTLSQQEIQQYINCPPNGSESDLVGYWNFEEGSGTTALDLTSNGNDGTINGATYSTDVPVQNCSVPCNQADIPTLSLTNNVQCIGENTTINITGNLNDATEWHIYNGSCGGTEIGTTASSSFPITPISSTTYYIRGEGGCVDETTIACSVITVTIDDITPPTAVCQNITAYLDGAGTVSIVADDIDGGSTDNCGTVNLSASITTFTCTDLGPNNITLTVDDGNGNSANCLAVVTLLDTIAPTAICQNIDVYLSETGDVTITAADIDNGSFDNCGNMTLSIPPTTFTCINLAPNNVTLTVDDGNGNSANCLATVTVLDTITPTVSCPANVVVNNDIGTCSATSVVLGNVTTGDNCSPLTLMNTSLVSYPLGVTNVIWTITDIGGNASQCTQTVTVIDSEAPVADLVTLADVTAECEVTALIDPTATDLCGIVVTTNDATLPISGEGTTTVVTWTYDDGNGNTSTQTQNIVIDDVTAPVADLVTLADVTAECEVTALTDPAATDNCGGIVTVTNDATLPISGEGTTTVVTWTYDDGNGNTSTQTQNIVIDDVTAPVADLVTLADVTAECEVTALTDPTATDNCGGIVTVTNDATLPISGEGTTTVVTWTYDDGNGNTSTQTQNIVIDDVTAPVADLVTLADVTAECEVTALTDPTATDNCGGIVTVTNDATLPISGEGTTTVVTWTYDDGNGNTSTQTQNIVIDDVTAPVADLVTLADVTAECEVPALTDPTATDNCGGIVTVTNDATLPISIQGTTTVTWTYDDGNGNTSTQTQNIVIDDVTAPVADLVTLADVTAECEVTALTDPTATDNCGGIVTVTNDATLPISGEGTTTVVTWTYDDGNGNTSTQTQNIVIDDVTAPVADLVTLADVTAECEVTALTDPTATDNCGGIVTVTNDATLPISGEGTTTVVTWTYDDGNGNTSTQTQNIVIDDVTAPVADLVTLADVTAECEVTALTDPAATDNCGGIVTVTNDATLPISGEGTTTVVTWTYDDGNGNTSTQTQNIVIDDVTAPVADLVTLADVTAECEVTALTDPTATDNCGGIVTVTNDATLPISGEGTTTVVTWTYDDGNGNTSTQTQNIVIDDVTAPVADLVTLADVTAECEVTALTDPTATDNCGGIVTVTNNATLPISIQGITTVTWTYDDGSGNTSTQTQNIVIDDVTAPVAICQNIDVYLDGAGNATIIAADIDGGSTDNCGVVSFSASITTFTCADLGPNNIIFTVDDGNGNSANCIAMVTITDTVAPVLTCPADVVVNNDLGVCSASGVALGAPLAVDNCSIFSITNNSLTIYPVGVTNITWSVTDINGNVSLCTQTVTVDDMEAPVLPVINDITVECGFTASIPIAIDNCTSLVIATTTDPLTYTTQGNHVINWSFDDGNGNSTTQTQNIIIDDVTAPIADILTLSDITAECEVTTITTPSATDNCIGLLLGTTTTVFPITTQGTTVVTWSYNDGNGNISTQTQNVIINDITAPVVDISTLSDVTSVCQLVSLSSPSASDNCNGTILGTTTAILPITAQGTTTVTWTYDDGNGNSSTQTQDIIINDPITPVVDVVDLPNITSECSVTSLTAPTATDNCAGSIIGYHDAILPISTQGTTVVTWTYDDGSGNLETQVQEIIINDISAPVPDEIVLTDIIAECSLNILIDPTATDNCNGFVTISNDANLPFTTIGTHVVTWIYTDDVGNSSAQTQSVIIQDVTAPVVDLSTVTTIVVECELLTLITPTATDNCTGLVLGTTTDPLTYTTQGNYVINWSFDDGNGNSTTQTQNIIIDDVTAPIADILTLSDITAECEVTTITTPSATDNCIGLLLGTTTTVFPITTQGTTVVTWSYNDGNGNISTQTQNVIINDITAPVVDISTLSDVTSVCQLVSLSSPSASDNCNGTILGTTTAILPITAQGTTTVTWTYDDGNGNSSTQTQDIIINDPITPVVDVVDLPNITSECSVTSLTAPTATDNCAGSIIGYHDAILPISTQGTTVVTWTYDDGSGNLETQVQEIIINDISAPVPDEIVLTDIIAECSLNILIDPTATDNCNGFVTISNDANLPFTTIGTHVVTWIYTDDVGNSSAQTQSVIIQDVTAPVVDLSTVTTIVVECELLTLITPTATDNCGGDVTITNDAQLPMIIPGSYAITWTFTDNQGNTTTEIQDVTINLIEACLGLVTVNDVITPNGDDINDYWVLENLSYTEGCNVKIFNRWGAQIFETENYDNTWNGTSIGGELLPEGVYYYIIQCYDNISFKGYITIIR